MPLSETFCAEMPGSLLAKEIVPFAAPVACGWNCKNKVAEAPPASVTSEAPPSAETSEPPSASESE